VGYRLLVAGEPKAIAGYRGFVEARADEAVELVSVRDARPALRVTLERGEQYLRLTALASLFLAGIAIAMAARRFATRHLDHCAILRTLGATQGAGPRAGRPRCAPRNAAAAPNRPSRTPRYSAPRASQESSMSTSPWRSASSVSATQSAGCSFSATWRFDCLVPEAAGQALSHLAPPRAALTSCSNQR